MLRTLFDLGREVVGEERVVGFARVLGWATAVLGEALVDAFRIQVEVPRLGAGTTYAEIVEQYTQLASAAFPTFVEGLGVLTRAHMLRMSRSAWAPDEEQSAVTREQTIGFADLVGYTGHSRVLSTTDLASAIGRFAAFYEWLNHCPETGRLSNARLPVSAHCNLAGRSLD